MFCIVILAMWPVSYSDSILCYFGQTWGVMLVNGRVTQPLFGRPTALHAGRGWGFVYDGWIPATDDISMPLWFLLALAAMPTAILWDRDRRTAKPGLCRQCGYDLRASKKTCPECGSSVPGAAQSV